MKAEIGGQVFTNQPLKLTALKASAPAANAAGEQLAFFKLAVPKKEVYVGEILAVEFQVYVREGVANAENILQSFDQYAGCPLKAEGVSIFKTAHAQARRMRVGNANYLVATLVTSLSPIKTGPLTLGSMDATLPLQLPVPGARRDIFGRMQVQEQRVALSADPETLTVLPLPTENIPADFNGAVGQYSMTLSVGPTNVATGDPITVKVQISGRGNLSGLMLPEQPAWRDFKAYPPTANVETTDPLGLQGTKTFEQVIAPQSPDITELPPLAFCYFDPDAKSYRTLTRPAVPLIVRPGGAAPTPTVAATSRVVRTTRRPHRTLSRSSRAWGR